MATLSLEALQKQITQQQSQLRALRRELEARQARLASLTTRKKDLQARLQQVEKEMAALATGAKAATAASPKPAKAKPAPGPKKHAVSLASLIVTILREAGRPRTVRELAAEAKRRGFHSTSRNFSRRVQNRVYELKLKGIVAPASGKPGYVLRGTLDARRDGAAGKETPARQPIPATKPAKVGPKPSPAKAGQPPLREVLTQIVQGSPKPLGPRELADAARKAGYRTTGKNLMNAVWVMAGKMDNLEHVPGKGYRLKTGRA